MSSGLTASNEAGAASIKRLRDHLRWWELESVFDAALRTERLRVVEQVRATMPDWFPCRCDDGYRKRDLVDPDCPTHDMERWLDEVAGLSGEEPDYTADDATLIIENMKPVKDGPR